MKAEADLCVMVLGIRWMALKQWGNRGNKKPLRLQNLQRLNLKIKD